eukprot:1628259-Amphidinium_carterae.3
MTARWKAYVKDTWERSPKKIYKWIRGTAAVWDLAILHENGYALSSDQAAQSDLIAWSKLWQPGRSTFPNKHTSASSWRTGDLRAVIKYCALGKARGVDRWSIAELRLLINQAIEDLATMLKIVEAEGTWPKAIRTSSCLRKELGTLVKGALSLYFPKSTYCGVRYAATMLEPGGPGVPALDETFDLAFETEKITAAGQAGIFLDCTLEQFALESGYPAYALYAALNMYAGRRRVLLQGGVSDPVTATHGMPPGCGHAVDLLHAFLLKP